MAVAWSHWRACWFPDSATRWGELGVDTFFIISGFLITGILLDHRSDIGRLFILRQFYVRRFLRIFPLFYATLAVALIWRATNMPESWCWHAAYLSNVYFYLWGWHGQLSHFWSLAVEEQFYLCWPPLMVFLPNRLILPVILTSVAIAPIFEIWMNSLYPGQASDVSPSVLMPSCLDALGMGALLAYGVRKGLPMRGVSRALLFLGLTACVTCGYFSNVAPVERLAEDCILGWVVYSASVGFQGPFGRMLESAPLNYLGRISYGLYIFHNFAGSMCLHLLTLIGNPAWLLKCYNVPVFRILVWSSVTIGLAAYSWHRFEKPINDLKRKFPYPDSGTAD